MNSKFALQMIAKGEGERIEFKESFAEENDAIESLCAFTHAKGGTVFFGVKNDGTIIGVTLGRNTLANFSNKLKQNTRPLLCPSVEKLIISGKIVVPVTIGRTRMSQVYYAFNKPYIRIADTDQTMSPEDVRHRLFKGFKAENPKFNSTNKPRKIVDRSWKSNEDRRIKRYEEHQGLFLIHTWKPSSKSGQVADIVISLWQHGDGPLNTNKIKSVEYHLGPKFFDHTVVKTNPKNGFRLEVSAYGPMLCLARVNFDDGTPSIDLERYIDF
jgi:hypothetical protein